MGNTISFSGGHYGKKKNCSYVLVVGFIIGVPIGGYAMIHQPHMVAALDRLKEAGFDNLKLTSKMGFR